MANSRARTSRKSTPRAASSRSRTPQHAKSSPLPFRVPVPSRRSSRLVSVKNSSPPDSEMDSEDIELGDSYLSRRAPAILKEVRIPTPESVLARGGKALMSSPSTAPSTSPGPADQQTNYETPATSAAATPANETLARGRRATRAALLPAEEKEGDNVIVLSRNAKGKRKMSEREMAEMEDSALAEQLQREEYDRLENASNVGSKRQRVIQASDDDDDDVSDLSDPEHDTEYESEDVPLARKRAPVKRQQSRQSDFRASNIVIAAFDSDDEEDDSFEPDESEAVESDEESTSDNSERAGDADNGPDNGSKSPHWRRARPMGGKRTKKEREAALKQVTELFSDDEDGKRRDPMKHRYWDMGRIERGQYTLNKHHPELKTLWDDLKNIPKIKPERRPQPAGLTRQMKPFQLEGLDWMMKQEKSCWKGGLLGDEMGMGKTIQAVALIMSDYETTTKPTLVVVPPVALVQWSSEISSYTNGKLKVLIHHNTDSKVKKLTMHDIKRYDVVLISYSGLESIHRKESKGWKRDDGLVKENSKIHAIDYHRLILDEAHNIKTRTTGVAKACFALQADFKWCLSGTPVQNRIGEFFSLLRFLEVRPFACYFCKQCDCNELHWAQDDRKMCVKCHHSGFNHISIFNQELLNPITHAENSHVRKRALGKLRLITDRIMLRRVKKDHTASMELPPKEIVIHNEYFGDVERDFSASIMTNSTRQFDTYVSRGVMLNNYANIFGLIMQMRQVANHPDLILKKHGEQGHNVLVCCICDEPAEEAIRSRCRHEFCRKCAKDYIRSFERDSHHSGAGSPDCPRCHIPLAIDFEQPDIEQEEDVVKKNSIINRIRMENWTSSTKIEMLVYDLYKLRSKKQTHKSIVFSQFTSMLQLVEWRLRRAGFNTVMLDGSMSPAQRNKSIEYFMNNVNVEVFLVSLKAGGVALNLTEASRVFIVDPWWNPAAEYQSADRCHRIGQRRPCIVKRLVIEDSVESRMVLLQEKKANMIAGTVDNDDVAIEKLTPEDMSFLFRGT